ncbi:uncharacterized protein Dwil_GK17126 [Drosophila willistoni]|uniref:DUF4794 domain-containing protein n=1 Tax=Drosophila willistoni TaxID=7260 RepID=B4MNF6_DROWI|nr:uncharacterized protein LOC6639201 [Drosophila willistoni]EDW72665.1 uncharacterized protein Dwil_GK17126 [Drosophila willistoni]
MLKQILATILLFSALSHAEPLRRRNFSARQVEAPSPPSPAPTGYPLAGVTPEIPFDLPSSTVEPQPEINYLPPDNTYGPPAEPDNVYGPPTNDEDIAPPTVEDEEEQQPEDDIAKQQPVDDVPPQDEEEDVLVEVAEDGTVIAVSTTLDQPQSGRLYQRFPQGNRRQPQPASGPVPQRLILRRRW